MKPIDLDFVLGSRYSRGVLILLAERQMRFNRLKEKIDGATGKTLSWVLRRLADSGLVVKLTEDEGVGYRLTARGAHLADIARDAETLVEGWG